MNDYLGLQGKTILVTGVANRKSVAFHIARQLQELGAEVVFSVRSSQRREQLTKWFDPADIFVCDVAREEEIESLAEQVSQRVSRLDGLVHSIAFADYRDGGRAFHETSKQDFLNAIDVS